MKAEVGDIVRIYAYKIGSPERQDFGKHVISEIHGDYAILETGDIVPRHYNKDNKAHHLSLELGMNLFYRLFKKTNLK